MIEAVSEQLEGGPRVRRTWSDDFKARAVAESLEPGMSVSAVARRIGVVPSQLFTWRRKALAPPSVMASKPRRGLIPLEIDQRSSTAEIIIGDAIIRAGVNIDEAHLARLIRAVRSA